MINIEKYKDTALCFSKTKRIFYYSKRRDIDFYVVYNNYVIKRLVV
jgi:hypothetical protein